MNPTELTTQRLANTVARYEGTSPVYYTFNQLDRSLLAHYKKQALAEPNLIYVYTASDDSDAHGFEALAVVGTFRPVAGNDKRLRLLANWKGTVSVFIVEHRKVMSYVPAWLQLVQDFTATTAGRNFRGFKGIKCRRLTSREQDEALAAKVFASA